MYIFVFAPFMKIQVARVVLLPSHGAALCLHWKLDWKAKEISRRMGKEQCKDIHRQGNIGEMARTTEEA